MASEGNGYHHNGLWKYDVFLSFRGEDIRKTFIDHLYSALERNCIYTFKDDEKLERGESISPALLKAIEESMIAVVVFSKNYASSRWCLDELVKIMDCRHRRCGSSSSSSGSNSSSMELGSQTVVIPIFYDVDPSDVRKPEYFEENIIKRHDPAKVEIWRQALQDAANLSGYVLKNTADGHEAKCIDIFVKDIWKKLPETISSEDECLVGMESRIEEVTSLLNVESDAVRLIGIWGLGGVGKTTLADAVFRRMKNKFQVAFYLEDFGEKSKRHGLRHLEKQLVNDLKIDYDCSEDKIMRRLHFKSVLLVLDDFYDVGDIDQLDVFVGKLRLFGPGSKVIITTRNKRTLDVLRVDEIYEAKLLNDGEAIRLFSRTAFKNIHPTKELKHLSYEVIHYANGLPLALKVLGSQLYGENMAFWEASLEKLRKEGPDGDILKKLIISFDDLDREVQDTFLDVACFFEGQEKEYVTRILDSFGFYPNRSIPLLVYKSLIYDSRENTLRMHNLIREMGRRIDREKPRRLWLINDFERILKCSTGAENIEGILLHPQTPEVKCIDMATEVFRMMRKLRLLVVRNVLAHRAPKYLPSSLQWLIWKKFPSESLPPMFEAYNIVGLELPYSNIKQLWTRNELEKLPEELGSLDCLKMLKLDETAITQPPLSIRCLNNLSTLSFNRSSQSSNSTFQFLFTRKRKWQEDDSTRSLVLPSVSGLCSLVYLDLAGCNMLDGAIPSHLESLCSLKKLNLQRNYFVELPSLDQLSRLENLYLDGCKMLEALPKLPSSIIKLTADDCPSLRLSVDRFTNCRELCNVSLKNCLQLLKEDNGESKNIAMSTLWHHMIQRRQLDELLELDIVLPGGDIPRGVQKPDWTEWTDRTGPNNRVFFGFYICNGPVRWFGKPTTGHSISLKLPSSWSRNFKGCGLCVAFDPRFIARPFTFFGTRKKVLGVLEITQKTCNNHQHLRGPYTEIFRKEVKNISMEHVYLCYVSFTYLGWHGLRLNDCCEVEVSFKTSIPNIVGVTQWGMVLVPKSPEPYMEQYDDDDGDDDDW
ncbi:hypothetical protein LguiA_004939 [Lonicera macranthoides]